MKEDYSVTLVDLKCLCLQRRLRGHLRRTQVSRVWVGLFGHETAETMPEVWPNR